MIQKSDVIEDLIFIRHAESELNYVSHKLRTERNLNYQWKILSKIPEFMSEVKYNPKLIDCPITKQGQWQCSEAKKCMDLLHLDVILVSPLLRTLQTCSLVFSNRNIPVFVEPLLAEAFRSSCDVSSDLESKQKQFPQYNFDSVLKQGDLWFVKNDHPENQEKYFKYLQENKPQTHEERTKLILKFMSETQTYEKPINVRRRSEKIKDLLSSYKQKYDKIAVVAHYNTVNFTVCEKFNEDHEPIDSAEVSNCQIYQANLKEILSYSRID